MLRARSGAINPQGVGMVILALALAIAFALVGIFVAGIIDDTMVDVFNSTGVPASWDNLRATAVNYTQNAVQIALVGIILVGVAVLLAVVFSLAKSSGA